MITDRQRRAIAGALIGGAVGLAAAVYCQLGGRAAAPPGTVFSGASQGVDQWTYFAMCRAIWASPNGFTYSYPYALHWPAPAVLFQFPLWLLAWIGRASGLPAAFEAGRVLGAAGTGAALALIGGRLFLPRRWRWSFWLSSVFCGGLFAGAAVLHALRISGIDGLTLFWNYLPHMRGDLFWWAPYPAENLRYPLECLYHALVFGALAALLLHRYRLAGILYGVTWWSNPFTAVALGATGLGWWAWLVLRPGHPDRRTAILHLVLWVGITGAGAAYYGPFLGTWPVLKNLSEQYHVALTPPLDCRRLLLLEGPWWAGLLWSLGSSAGRRHVWGRPAWRLFGLLALSQLFLLQQGILLGERALQPFHFNRGYLHLGVVALTWRFACGVAAGRRRRSGKTGSGSRPASSPVMSLPKWALAAVLFTLPEQPLFLLQTQLESRPVGIVPAAYAKLVERLHEQPASSVVLVEPPWLPGSYVAAYSKHVAYEAPETLVVPFPEERSRRLAEALSQGGDAVAALGVRYAIVQRDGSRWESSLRRQGWRVIAQEGDLSLLGPPSRQPFPL